MTRPYNTFAISKVAQFLTSPQECHAKLSGIFSSLFGTQTHDITLSRMNGLILVGYCNVNWAGDVADRRSQTWYFAYIRGTLVSWASKKQTSVSRSNTEVEYRSIKLHSKCSSGSNPLYLARTKHVAIDLHFVRERERVAEKRFKTLHISSDRQQADILTKPLNPKPFLYLKSNLIDQYHPP